MRHLLVALVFTFLLADNSYSQGVVVGSYNGSENLYMRDKRQYYFLADSYMINGRQVFGFPYLFHDWENGMITTTDGRVFNGYKLKYNAFSQTVYFTNGTDSLEVNDEIKEFKLMVAYPDSVATSSFVNAAQYQKVKKPLFYELLVNNTSGQLLRVNKKVVTEASQGIPAYEGKKVFTLELSYFYYDKIKKEVTAIKANGSNVAIIVGLDDAGQQATQLSGVDFTNEAQVIGFFERLGAYQKSKGM